MYPNCTPNVPQPRCHYTVPRTVSEFQEEIQLLPSPPVDRLKATDLRLMKACVWIVSISMHCAPLE